MNTNQLNFLPKSEIEITITIPGKEIKEAYQIVLEEVVKDAEVKGFRKGKAPKDIVEKNTDKLKIYQKALQDLLTKSYSEAITKNNLQPILEPQITLTSPKTLEEVPEAKEIIFKALTCLKPEVKLLDYKDKIKTLKAKKTIWVPGKDKEEKKEETKTALSDIIKTLLEIVSIELPPQLISFEVSKLLSQTLQEIKKLGLTLEQYLSSIGKTVEELKAESEQKAINELKLEFALNEIAKTEKITVSEEEIQKVIAENKDPQAQENLKKQSYYIAAVLLQQKTLDFLKTL